MSLRTGIGGPRCSPALEIGYLAEPSELTLNARQRLKQSVPQPKTSADERKHPGLSLTLGSPSNAPAAASNSSGNRQWRPHYDRVSLLKALLAMGRSASSDKPDGAHCCVKNRLSTYGGRPFSATRRLRGPARGQRPELVLDPPEVSPQRGQCNCC